MSEPLQPSDSPASRKPAIPPREPKGEAEWQVTARHSPLKVKRLVVKASSRTQAWQRFLDQVEAKTTLEAFRNDGRKEGPKNHRLAHEWLATARKETPDGVEVLGADYVRARLNALRVKGTVSVDQIGFPELASV